MQSLMILNEKELRDAKARVGKLTDALASKNALNQVVAGLPPEVVSQVTDMMGRECQELVRSIEAYESAKDSGEAKELVKRAGSDPGLTLIVARIAKGFSQKELAWRLGVKEQQVQRYEADRYSTISLKNYKRVAVLLGVRLEASIRDNPAFHGLDQVIGDVSKADIKKILKHGRDKGWFPENEGEAELRQSIAENRIQFGSPSLLRTGLNVTDHSEDLLLHAWRARISARAQSIIPNMQSKFDPLDIGWLPQFVELSAHDDGPIRARKALRERGLILIVEPHIPGLAIDGAAYLDNGVPIIGMTLRKDTLDSFWFTLLHELGHAILHYRSGLAVGFFDQIEAPSVDEQEAEADTFAANMLLPEERWRRSTARISNSNIAIEKFAREIGIHPAIVFGRIRKERDNYAIFSSKIGAKAVRKQFANLSDEEA